LPERNAADLETRTASIPDNLGMHDLRRRLLTLGALLLILGFAAGLRVYGLNWDAGQHLHPDERFLAIVGSKIRFPSDPLSYFDTRRSPLNPYNARDVDGFAYGTAPLFLMRAVADRVGLATYDGVPIVGRWLSTLADLGTVLLVFLLGRTVYGTAVGLVAAALAAATVLQIQLAHFFAVDTFLAFATTLALYAAYRSWLRWGYASFALLGFAAGLALATKLSAALLAPVVLLAAVVPPPDGRPRRPTSESVTMLAMCGLVAFVTYRVGEPYSFVGPSFFGILPNFQRFDDLYRWVKISSGEIEVPFMIQWASTPNPRFALTSLVQWGFGPAAGLAALLGLGVAGLELVRWHRHGRNLLLVVWAAINLAYFGFQFAKFMRYFLPVYPALAVLAAYLLVQVLPRLFAPLRSPWPKLARLVAPAVVAATALFALSFVTIYSRPNTRVAASEWIYQHVPPGSTLAVEHWDDALPLRMPGYDQRYGDVSMNLYDDESPDKERKLVANLDKADYLILASNRLYGSIPRLPNRYPLAIAYYRALFDGRLGYDLVARFDSNPSLLGITLDSSAAQEDFTVYDHPTVLIFQKSDRFSAQRADDVLGAVPLDQLERTKPVEASARHGLMLGAGEWQRVQASGSWADSFSLDGLTTALAVPIWLVAVELLGLAAFPLCWLLLPGLADRGYGVAKVLGPVVVAYLAWLAASIGVWQFGRGLVLASVLALLLAGGLAARRSWAAFSRDVRQIWRGLAAVELMFLAGLGLMLLIRALNPDLWHPSFGGEKPMDFAYLNAVIKTPTFPPYDPWFAGGYINYYYYGFVLVAVLVHLTAVLPSIAYNLAIATVFALTGSAAFAIAVSLVAGPGGRRGLTRRAIIAGVGSAVALTVLGNLDGAVQLVEGMWKAGGSGLETGIPVVGGLGRALAGLAAITAGAPWPAFDFWRSTRFIGPEDPGPIHEFPFFTFLYGDLHAHMLSMPLQVTAVAVALQAARLGRAEIVAFGALREPAARAAALRGVGRPLALVALAGLLVGTLRATNTWELPTYLALAGLMALVAARPGRWTRWPVALAGAAVTLGAVYAVSSALFAPFLARYELFYSGVVPVKTPTAPGQFLLINGTLLFAVLAYLTYRLARSATVARLVTRGVAAWSSAPASSPVYLASLAPTVSLAGDGPVSPVAMALLALAVVLWAGGYGTLGLLVVGGGIVAALALLRRSSREMLFMAGIAAAALGSLALPEVVAVKGDVGRMNTVFKFYLQAWILLAILAGPCAVLLARDLFGAARKDLAPQPTLSPSTGPLRLHERRAPSAARGAALPRDPCPAGIPVARDPRGAGSPCRGGEGELGGRTAVSPIGIGEGEPSERGGKPSVGGDDSVVGAVEPSETGGELGRPVPPDPPSRPARLAGVWRYGWGVALVALVLACAVYPIMATRVKLPLRFEPLPPTLDGMAYMADAAYKDRDRDLDLPSDWRAIRWMLEHVEGSPVILEGNAPLYHWGSRFSIYTGLPTLIGWDWHQKQQRWGYQDRVEQRLRDVSRFYETTDPETAWAIVRKYGVRLVVVGGLERAYYPAAGLAKLDRMVGDGLEVAYSQGGVTIYEVARP
jgi:YYY domain-containing protein